MYFTKSIGLAILSAMVAQQASAYLGVAYSGSNFNGREYTIGDNEGGRCHNLPSGVRNSVDSVRVGRGASCRYWSDRDCNGRSQYYDRDDRHVSGHNYDSVRCERGR